jgi:hypothetical protein
MFVGNCGKRAAAVTQVPPGFPQRRFLAREGHLSEYATNQANGSHFLGLYFSATIERVHS